MVSRPDEVSDGSATESTADGASIRIQRRVEWVDTDASTKWHNTAALRMLEAAETALLDRLGLLEEVYGRLPRVSIQARFLHVLRFREKVDVDLTVTSLGRTSITYRGSISNRGEVAATGEVVAVLVDDAGRPRQWTTHQRKLLGAAGPQTPELLAEGT
jgi:acyl-CoA thioesterase FadM